MPTASAEVASCRYNYIKSKRGDPHVIQTVATAGLLNATVRPELELPLDIFTPLAMFATDPQVIALRVESKFNTFNELVEAAKREPGTISVGISGGNGNRAPRVPPHRARDRHEI